MRIGDHQLHTAKAPSHQRAQELRPERLGFRGTDRHAEDLAHSLAVDSDGDYHGHRHDTSGLAGFHVSGINPQIRPISFDRPIQEGVDALVDLCAQSRDLALTDATHAHRLDELVHRACGNALHISFLDHGGEGLFGRATRLQKTWEIAAFAQFRDLQIDRSGTCVPRTLTKTVAAIGPIGAALAVGGRAQVLDVHVHHPLRDVANHLAHQIDVGTLFGKLCQCHSAFAGGHCVSLC